MRSIVIYYSMKGNTQEIARSIARELGSDLEAILPEEKLEAEKFMSYYWSGDKKAPTMRIKIEELKKDPSEYDLIIIGTPVWAWAPSPPIHSFLSNQDLENKKIALFSTSEGENGKTFEKMRGHLEGNTIISQMDFQGSDPIELRSSKKKAVSWARKLKEQLH